MRNGARIAFKVFLIIYIVCLALCVAGGVVVCILAPMIHEGFMNPNNWHPTPEEVDPTLAMFATVAVCASPFLCIIGMGVGIFLSYLGLRKTETARKKDDIIPIAVLDIILGGKIGGILLLVSKEDEWPDGQKQSEY